MSRFLLILVVLFLGCTRGEPKEVVFGELKPICSEEVKEYTGVKGFKAIRCAWFQTKDCKYKGKCWVEGLWL